MFPYDHSIEERRESCLSFALRRAVIEARFWRRLGKRLDCVAPQSTQEKTQFRKLYGNHTTYAALADKYGVRRYVAERVGERYLIPLLGVYERLTPDVFRSLPDRFIIKATHGCKWYQIVRDKSQLDVAATVRRFNRLVARQFGGASGERHYRLIPPRIVIEELLDDGGSSPPDYDFFCFHTEGTFEHSLTVVMPDTSRVVHFDDDWRVVDGTCTPEEVARVARPQNFDEMLAVAENLSRGFDFIRIDLYNVAGRVYFGEVTCTPASGLRPTACAERAERNSRLWKLDRHNPRLYRQAA